MKLFDKIIENIDKISDINFTRDALLEYNLVKIFSPIYAINKEVRLGNICTSFIILAYSNGCKWLDYTKDRKTVKLEVFESILFHNKIEPDEEFKLWMYSVIDGEIEEIENVISDFVNWQKNSLFESYITISSHISFCNRNGRSAYNVTSKILNERTKFLENLTKFEDDKAYLIKQIEAEFQPLDESLKQEKKIPISKRTGQSSWEDLLSRMNVSNE